MKVCAQVADYADHVSQRPVEQCVAPRCGADIAGTYAVIECRHHINHDHGHDKTEENAFLAVTGHGTSLRYAFDALMYRPLWSVPPFRIQCLHRTLIVGDEHDSALILGDSLLPKSPMPIERHSEHPQPFPSLTFHFKEDVRIAVIWSRED